MTGLRSLVIETSGPTGSVALAVGGVLRHERRLGPAARHTAALLPAVRELCATAGWRPRRIEAVFFSCGPGSFTGLRLAATVARMFQWTTGCAVVAVPTLEVIARNVLDLPIVPDASVVEGQAARESCAAAPFRRVVAILDARRGQAFAAMFERDASELATVEPAALREPAAWLTAIPQPFCIIGEGIVAHRDACVAGGARLLPESCWAPRAAHVAVIGARLFAAGHVCQPQEIRPLYLRRPEAEEVYEQRRATARARRGE